MLWRRLRWWRRPQSESRDEGSSSSEEEQDDDDDDDDEEEEDADAGCTDIDEAGRLLVSVLILALSLLDALVNSDASGLLLD